MKATHITLLIALIFNFSVWAISDNYVLLEKIIGQLSAEDKTDIYYCRITINDLTTADYNINRLNNSIIIADNSDIEEVYHFMANIPSIEFYAYPMKSEYTDEHDISDKVLLYSSYELTRVREGDAAARLIEIISDFCT